MHDAVSKLEEANHVGPLKATVFEVEANHLGRQRSESVEDGPCEVIELDLEIKRCNQRPSQFADLLLQQHRYQDNDGPLQDRWKGFPVQREELGRGVGVCFIPKAMRLCSTLCIWPCATTVRHEVFAIGRG